MRLSVYLSQEKLSPAAFGALRSPATHRSTIRQWAEGSRFPKDPSDLAWVESVTGGKVTPADFVAHALELRAAKGAEAAE